eukprot:2666204-Pyramimonas_sp.AAC.1
MQPVGCWRGLRLPTMPVERRRVPGPRKAHIKYVNIQPVTIVRYRRAIHRFFSHLACNGIRIPETFEELDNVVG